MSEFCCSVPDGSDRFTADADPIFELDPVALALVAPHRSTDPNRPILQAVYFDSGGVLVATNGHRLAAMSDAHSSPMPLLVTADWKRVLAVVPKRAKLPMIQVRLLRDTVVFWHPEGDATVTGQIAEGPYPAWRRVITYDVGKATGRIVLSPDYIATFCPSGKRLADEVGKMVLHTQDEGRCVVIRYTSEPRFLGLLMPCRTDSVGDNILPEWFTGKSAGLAAAA